MDYDKRVFKKHSWLKLSSTMRKCTICGAIKHIHTGGPTYIKNNIEFKKTAPDCNYYI